VFTAKFVVITAAVAVGGAVVVASATVFGWLVIESRGGEVDFSDSPGGLAPIVGSVALMTILTWLGYGLGLLTRSSPLAIVILVLWPLLIENIVGGLLFVAGVESALRWLPYNAGFVLASTEIPEDSMGRWQGGLYFAVITLALVVVGALSNRGRDA
jgi:ABC-2 type transport system permease protein